MTRLGITFDEVASAAENILAANENPTIERVRRVLGTGSNSTIAKHLQDWRVKRLLSSSQKTAVTNTAPDAVNAAVTQVWEKIRLEAAAEIKAAHDQAAKQVEIAHQERDEAKQSCERIQQELETLTKRFHQLSADKEIASLDLKAIQSEHLLLQERYHHLETQHHTFKTMMQDQITLLTANHQTELNNKNKEMAAIQETHDKLLNKLVEAYENSRQEHMVAIDHHKTEKQRDRDTIKQLQSTLQVTKDELVGTRTRFALAINERDAAFTQSRLKDEIIRKQEENKDNIQQILTAFETFKQAHKTDFESFISQLECFNNRLASTLEALRNEMTSQQKELTEPAG